MEKRIVTIFIHGTLPPQVFLKIPLLKNFFGSPKGLHRLIDHTEKFHLASLGALLCEEDPVLFDKNFFYLFGWSGRLSVTARRKAAGELASLLSELMHQYSSKGIDVSLRIIAHSHGGNVALHMAEIASDLLFTIDELMLLACPVQKATAKYSIHPFFGSIYSIHSHADMTQRMDPQGIYNFFKSIHTNGLEFTVGNLDQVGPLFSARHFNPSRHLTQVHVKYPSRELFHIEFILPDYIKSLPAFIRHIHRLPKEDTAQEELLYIIPTGEKQP